MDLQTDQKFLIRGSIINGLGVVVRSISPLIVILVARVFGKETFGVYVSAQLWVLTISRVLVLGLDKGLNWFVPRNQLHQRPVYFGIASSIWWTTFFAIIFVLVSALLLKLGFLNLFPGLSELNESEVFLYTLSLVPLMGVHICAGAAEGKRLPQYKILINQFLVTAAAPLCAIAMHLWLHIPNALAWGLIAGNTLGLLVYLILMPHIFPGFRWTNWNFPAKELVIYSLPLGVAEVVSSFLMRLDLWMVLSLLGPAKAGVYAVMITIANALRTIRQSFDPLMTPVVAALTEERTKKELPELYSYGVNMVSTVQLVIGFFILFMPGEVLAIAGKDYAVEFRALGVLLLGNLLNGYLGLAGSVLLGKGRSAWIMRINLYSLVLNLGLNLLLIPRLGVVGAACSSVGASFVQVVSMNVALWRRGYRLYKPYTLMKAFWILIFIFALCAFPLYGDRSLLQRSILLLGILSLLGTGVWINRKHYSFKRPEIAKEVGAVV